MADTDTKQRILDAAERLFARGGFEGTSLRAITAEARANLAAVNYHFGSKDGLIRAVIERRLSPLNEARLQRIRRVLERSRRRGGRPGLEEVLRAFVEPTLGLLQQGPGAREFATLVGRALVEPDGRARGHFLALVAPVFRAWHEAVCAALPGRDRAELFWRLQFAIGAISHTLRWAERFGQLAADSPFLPQASVDADATQAVERLTRFLVAGMDAPCVG